MTERVKIENLEKRFPDLHQTAAIARAALESTVHNPEITTEELIYTGYGSLIDQFNAVDDDPFRAILPHVAELKALLQGVELPTIQDLAARDLVRGIRVSNELMLEGQINKQRRQLGDEPSRADIDHAIGAPSVDTYPQALAVGAASHIIERTIMAHLKSKGLDTDSWVKDQVLWALEDLAVLSHIQDLCGMNNESELYHYFASAPSPEKNGGMGWRNRDMVLAMIKRYWDVLDNEQTDIDPDQKRYQKIRLLPELLNFERTVSLKKLESKTADTVFKDVGMSLGRESLDAMHAYADATEAIILEVPSSEQDRRNLVSVGQIIATGVVYKRTRRLKNYIEALSDALDFYQKTAKPDSRFLNAINAELDYTLELQSDIIGVAEGIIEKTDLGISEEDFAGIDNMYPEEAFEYIFQILTDYDVEDPEALLAEIGVVMRG